MNEDSEPVSHNTLETTHISTNDSVENDHDGMTFESELIKNIDEAQYSSLTQRSNENELLDQSQQPKQVVTVDTHQYVAKQSTISNMFHLCAKAVMKAISCVGLCAFHMLTSLMILTQAILFSVMTLLCTFDVIPFQFQLFENANSDEIQREIRRRSNPRMGNQAYDQNYYLTRMRRQQHQQDEIAMTQLREQETRPRRPIFQGRTDISPTEQQVVDEFGGIPDANSLIRRNRSRTTYQENIPAVVDGNLTEEERRRRNRDYLRSQLISYLRNRAVQRQALNSNAQMFIRNLQMLQVQISDRDFNENDYEMLTALDNQNSRFDQEKVQLLISQLPTYKFQNKISPRKQDVAASQDEEVEQLQNQENDEMVEIKNTCTVCLERFDQDESIKLLPCFHQFHSGCIDDWLSRKTLCPVCKYDISSSSDYSSEQFV